MAAMVPPGPPLGPAAPGKSHEQLPPGLWETSAAQGIEEDNVLGKARQKWTWRAVTSWKNREKSA